MEFKNLHQRLVQYQENINLIQLLTRPSGFLDQVRSKVTRVSKRYQIALGPTNVEHALRDDLKSAKARNATNATKLMALSSARDFLESGRPLGGELTNVTDLICSLIRSGVTANSLEALMVAPLVVPHLVSEPILLPSLLNAAAERMNSNGKTQSAALNLIDTSKIARNCT